MRLENTTAGAGLCRRPQKPGFGRPVGRCVPGGTASAGCLSGGRGWSGCRGFTLVEVLVAGALGVLVTGILMGLVVQVAKEQRRGVVDACLQNEADILEEKVVRLFREMSASETVILNNPVTTGSPLYRQAVMARGGMPTWPRQQLTYDPAALTLKYDPNRTVSADEVTWFPRPGVASLIKLRNMYFFTSVKLDGASDSSALNVYLEFDDDGWAGRKNPNGTAKRSQVTRHFTVKMRNY